MINEKQYLGRGQYRIDNIDCAVVISINARADNGYEWSSS